MKKHGIDVRLQTEIAKVTKNESKLSVHLSDGNIVDAEKVLLSIGRSPNVQDLHLERTSIKVESNAVWVDEYQNTSCPNVYAIGDCINNI